jgi:hypothetical protein
LTPTGGANKRFLDPTSGNGGTAAFYSTNLIRALAGSYPGWGAIQAYTQDGESYYNALQVAVNRRFSSRLQFGANYTWSKTITYSRQQWVDDQLTKNVTSNRPHAVNLNWGYDVPNLSRQFNHPITRQIFDGWHLSGVGTFYYGQALTIGCSANGAPAGFWTGTPTGGIPFRCQMNGPLFLDGATPSSVYGGSGSALANGDPRLWYTFNPQSFTLPAASSLGSGNTPPTLTYGPGGEFRTWPSEDFRSARPTATGAELKADATTLNSSIQQPIRHWPLTATRSTVQHGHPITPAPRSALAWHRYRPAHADGAYRFQVLRFRLAVRRAAAGFRDSGMLPRRHVRLPLQYSGSIVRSARFRNPNIAISRSDSLTAMRFPPARRRCHSVTGTGYLHQRTSTIVIIVVFVEMARQRALAQSGHPHIPPSPGF